MHKHLVIGVSLSEPHASCKVGMVVTYTIKYEKSEHYPYLVGMVVMYANNHKKKQTIVWYNRSGMENNKLSLLMLHIWLVRLLSHGE